MSHTTAPVDQRTPHVSSALVVSALSVLWTSISSGIAIALGIRDRTLVLLAFGAIGVLDGAGSVALLVHFQHARRHGALSRELERLSHRIVLVGLFIVGTASVGGGITRLILAGSGRPSNAGVALACASLFVLVWLSLGKRRIACRVVSPALASDGHLSAVGAVEAGVTLMGTVLARAWGLGWADAAATAGIGCVAMFVAGSTWRATPR